MPNVLVRDLPDDIHAGLQRRAEAAGQSLQQYLATELTRLATTPTMAEVLERIGRQKLGRVGFEAAVGDVSEARGRR
jgi:plasmid stability protein